MVSCAVRFSTGPPLRSPLGGDAHEDQHPLVVDGVASWIGLRAG